MERPLTTQPYRGVQPFRISEMSTNFIQAMVRSMYDFGAAQHNNPELLSGIEKVEFYLAYMGSPLCS
jgi:hypothetical protein